MTNQVLIILHLNYNPCLIKTSYFYTCEVLHGDWTDSGLTNQEVYRIIKGVYSIN